MVLTLMSVCIPSAASSSPGKVKLTSVKAKNAPPKVGKGTVIIKWKKLRGVSKYQVFVKRINGKWHLVKTVRGSKSKAKVKAYVGINYVRVRAVKGNSSNAIYGKYSKSKKIRVNSRRTIQKYMKSHPRDQKQIDKHARETGVKVKIRDNDVIYIYDIANIVDDERYVNKELKRQIRKSLINEKDTFTGLVDKIERDYKINGCRIIVKCVYNGSKILTHVFQ